VLRHYFTGLFSTSFKTKRLQMATTTDMEHGNSHVGLLAVFSTWVLAWINKQDFTTLLGIVVSSLAAVHYVILIATNAKKLFSKTGKQKQNADS
jgi:hypothetical protein